MKTTKTLTLLSIIASFVASVIYIFYTQRGVNTAYDVIFYILLLTPLSYGLVTNQLNNRYTKYTLPFIFIWLANIFIYHNTLVTYWLPTIILVTIIMLYITSMHFAKHFYQVLLPYFAESLNIKEIYERSFPDFKSISFEKKSLTKNIKSIIISIIFATIFIFLFLGADTKFNIFFSDIFTLKYINFKQLAYLFVSLFAFLSIMLYGFSNLHRSKETISTPEYEKSSLNIFFLMINFVFIAFCIFQIYFLIDTKGYLGDTNPAYFARKGFFQLAFIVILVSLIILFTSSSAKKSAFLKKLSILLVVQTIIIAFSALKKMQLYKSLMGPTVLRYYVEWFEYFLIIVLILSVLFMVMNFNYEKLIDLIFAFALISFSIIASTNIDHLVAKGHIELAKQKKISLDAKMLRSLSIDAKTYIDKSEITLP
ncbi:MAG: DUF4173 domain-containing protein [Sulfurovaceae bacterium]